MNKIIQSETNGRLGKRKTGVLWWIIFLAMRLWVLEITNMTDRATKENGEKILAALNHLKGFHKHAKVVYAPCWPCLGAAAKFCHRISLRFYIRYLSRADRVYSLKFALLFSPHAGKAVIPR